MNTLEDLFSLDGQAAIVTGGTGVLRLLTAIASAARCGVDVHLVVSAQDDQFLVSRAQLSYYEEMHDAGVRIHTVPPPAFIYANHLSIDDDIAVIGSSNMDICSFQLDLEVTLVCYNTQVVAEMQQVFTVYLRHSQPLQLDTRQARPLVIKLFDNLARLTSALQ